MNGMAWQADDPKRPIEAELTAAINHAKNKYGRKPAVILAHNSTRTEKVAGVVVKPSHTISYPNYYILAWEA